MTKRYLIGVDLHGTLLGEGWRVTEDARPALTEALTSVRDFCRVYVCSGNDRTFIDTHVPDEVRACFDGFVLETGCVLSDGASEEIIVPEQLTRMIHALRARLETKAFPEVKCFGRRLITISLFTRDESGGLDPAAFHPKVDAAVREAGFDDRVLVTHSDVAVDIVPKGYNKFTGLRHAGAGLRTIGIADSLNDIHLIRDADHAFLPANASPKLAPLLAEAGMRIEPLTDDAPIEPNVVLQSPRPATWGLVDALRFIDRRLR